MKDKNKIIFLTILFVATLVVIPLTYAKYTDTFTKHISLNIRKPEYTITFHSNNGSDTTSTQDFVYGNSQNLNINTFTLDHNTFTNWNTSINGSGTSFVNGESVSNLTQIDGENINLYAIWTPYEYKITYSGLSDTTNLPEYALANNTLTINNINSSIYDISSVVMGSNTLSSSDYSFSNNELVINTPITSEITLTFAVNASYTFIVDGTTDDGTNITYEAPITTDYVLNNLLSDSSTGLNISTKNITKIEIFFTYTTTKGSSNTINVNLTPSVGSAATQVATFKGKQTNQTASVTFTGLNIPSSETFSISYTAKQVNNLSVDIDKVEVKITLSDN